MAAKRTAHAVWQNDLLHGSGHVEGTSGALPRVAVSWSSRTEASGGKSSPEELLAAAHAACYSMALSNTLAKQGKPPTSLDIRATCTFDKVGDGWSVTTMDLEVVGSVPGIEAAQFQEAAKSASVNCPISRALKGNVEVRVASAKLA
ncbi:MAG TPA: OsmC family peroxiredoxin [Thermoplasmata archaeon]|nr:OsmC family peroxiredoxin [Thermoplasmata archaeon]